MKTSLFENHKRMGAKLIPFAGYDMPVSYPSGIQAEYRSVRTSVGIFDVSHMGEFRVAGSNALEFLQKTTINDISRLEIGDAQYSAMCLPHGGIVDDLIVYRRDDGFLLVVNAANIEKDFSWLDSHRMEGVTLGNQSNQFSLIAIQGPRTREVLRKLTDMDLDLKFYSFRNAVVAGQDVMLSRTGYTGELGFEIYSGHEAARTIWDRLSEDELVAPAGLAARDILRMEMKYALYGNDIDETTNPIEAGLGWITSLDKGDFIGRDAIVAMKENKPQRRLITFRLNERGIPRKGYPIQIDGEQVGTVTSGTQSPTLNAGIGLAYMKTGLHKSGTEIDVIIRDKPVKGVIVKPPFIKNTSLMS